MARFFGLVMFYFQLLFSLSVFADDSSDSTAILYATDFPPYEIKNSPIGGLRGFDVEVIEAAFAREGQSVEFKFLPWKRIVRLIKSGQGAGMLSCAYNKEREEYVLFSNPISYTTRTFAVREDHTGVEILGFADAASLEVVVVSGYSSEKELITSDVPHKAVINDKVALNLLLFRNMDAFFTSKESVMWLAKKMGHSDKLRFFDLPQSKRDYHLCFSRKWPGVKSLANKFNSGLAQIKADGTLEAIHAKYR